MMTVETCCNCGRRQKGIAFDAELLYVSSMLHALGLVKEFDSHSVPFEEAGGHVAWVEQVAGAIRAKRWGGSGRGRPGNLAADAGQTGPGARIAFPPARQTMAWDPSKDGHGSGWLSVLP